MAGCHIMFFAGVNFTRRRNNFDQYRYILLLGDRSDKGGPRDILVAETLPGYCLRILILCS